MRVLIFACSWSFMRIWECSLSNAVRFWFIRNCNAATESGNYLATKTAATGNWRFNSIFFAAYRDWRVEANRCYLSGRNQLYNSCSVKLNCHEQSQTASDLTTDATVDALPATHTTKCGTWALSLWSRCHPIRRLALVTAVFYSSLRKLKLSFWPYAKPTIHRSYQVPSS